MILYNVTIKIARDNEEEWLHWMKSDHIPEVMKTGMFTGFHVCRLLEQAEDEDTTYVIQYRCENKEKLDHYFKHFAPALRAQHDSRYKNKFVAFRTVMEIV